MTAIDRDIKRLEEQIHSLDIDLAATQEHLRDLERRRQTLVSAHVNLLVKRERTSAAFHKFNLKT